MKRIVGVGAMLVVAVGIVWVAASAFSSSSRCDVAKERVLRELYSPGSAEWVRCEEIVAMGDYWTISLTVDSHNRFGALERSMFIVKADGGSENLIQIR